MKIKNDNAYQAYNNLITGYNQGDITRGFDHESNKLFVRGAISLASLDPYNPFPSGTPEAHLFFKLHYCYGMWRRGGIDHKVNRSRMLQAAADLAAMQLENPYEAEKELAIDTSDDCVSLEAQAEAEINRAIAEDIESGTYVPAADVKHIFGVLPEQEDE